MASLAHLRCSFLAAECLHEGGPDPEGSNPVPCSQRGSDNGRPGKGGVHQCGEWAGSQGDQCWSPLLPSISCTANGGSLAPLRMVSCCTNLSFLRRAAPMSNGMWMQQEKPAPPGKAAALLHCSAAMTVTKCVTKLFVLNTESIKVAVRARQKL